MKSSKRVVLAILMLVAATFTFMPLAQAAGEPQASVQVAALNVRQGPGTGYEVLTVVHAGDNLAVSGQNSAAGWYQIRLADGRQGWVLGSLVQLAGDSGSLPEVA